jgi:hypothetical protein
MKRITVILTTLIFTVFGQVAFGFGIPDIPGIPSIPGVGAAKSVEAGPLVGQLNEVLVNLVRSDGLIQDALKISGNAAEREAIVKKLDSGTATDPELLKKVTADQDKTSKDLKAFKGNLDAESKKKLAEALPYYGKALARSAGLAAQLTGAAQAITANPMSVVGGTFSAPDLINIFTTSPGVLKNLVTTGYDLSTFAKVELKDDPDAQANIAALK